MTSDQTHPTSPGPGLMDGLKFMGLILPVYILGLSFAFSYEIWGIRHNWLGDHLGFAILGLAVFVMMACVLLVRHHAPPARPPWRLALVALQLTILCFACGAISILGSIFSVFEAPIAGPMLIYAAIAGVVGLAIYGGRLTLGQTPQSLIAWDRRGITVTCLIAALLVLIYCGLSILIAISTFLRLDPLSAWLIILFFALTSSGIAAWTITRSIGHICKG